MSLEDATQANFSNAAQMVATLTDLQQTLAELQNGLNVMHEGTASIGMGKTLADNPWPKEKAYQYSLWEMGHNMGRTAMELEFALAMLANVTGQSREELLALIDTSITTSFRFGPS